jgi:serine/threonine-protein kinase RIO1
VEESHPFSHEFLKRDIININNFFKKLKVNVFPVRQVFRWATDYTIDDDSEAGFLEVMMDESMDYA